MDKFKPLASSNCCTFVPCSNFLVQSVMGTMNSIMALTYQYGFNSIHGSRFLGQSKDKAFVFKMSLNIPTNGVEFLKCMQGRGDIENFWIMLNHNKHLKNWTTMACHVYDTKQCEVLTIARCDVQSEGNDAQALFWENLNVVMVEKWVAQVNFKGFMANNAQTNWNVVRKIYGNGELIVPIEDCEHIYLFH